MPKRAPAAVPPPPPLGEPPEPPIPSLGGASFSSRIGKLRQRAPQVNLARHPLVRGLQHSPAAQRAAVQRQAQAQAQATAKAQPGAASKATGELASGLAQRAVETRRLRGAPPTRKLEETEPRDTVQNAAGSPTEAAEAVGDTTAPAGPHKMPPGSLSQVHHGANTSKPRKPRKQKTLVEMAQEKEARGENVGVDPEALTPAERRRERVASMHGRVLSERERLITQLGREAKAHELGRERRARSKHEQEQAIYVGHVPQGETPSETVADLRQGGPVTKAERLAALDREIESNQRLLKQYETLDPDNPAHDREAFVEGQRNMIEALKRRRKAIEEESER